MFARYAMSLGGALICASALSVVGSAQSAQPAGGAPSAAATTVQGCLVRAQDVPGRSPNVANPAGVAEGYVLMQGGGGAVGTAGAGNNSAAGTSGASAGGDRATTATATIGPLYKVSGIGDAMLRPLVGKRVELEGSVNRAAASDRDADSDPHETSTGNANPVGPGSQTQTGTDANAGRGDEKDHWMEFKATSIREVSGSCPVAPVGTAK